MKSPNGYTIKRKYQGEPIQLDPTADPKENETAIHFSGGDRLAWISSYEPAVVEGLLHHRSFRLEQLITMKINGCDSVVGLIGRVPIGALRIGRRRSSDRHDLIISPR